MNPSNFDELTKALANSSSRRHALRLIVTTAVGGLLGLTSVSTAFGRHRTKTNKPSGPPPGNSKCSAWCAQVFGANTAAAGQCTSMAAKGKGPCATCGSHNPSDICCTKTNPPNGPCTGGIVAGCVCGGCGTCDYSNQPTCPSSCSGSTPDCCGNTCTNTQSDESNCGQCGHACAPGQTCCSGTCRNTDTDSNNCGACGTVCPSGQACCQICDSGQCVPSNVFSCLCVDDTSNTVPMCSTLECTEANGSTVCADFCASHQGVLRTFCGAGIC